MKLTTLSLASLAVMTSLGCSSGAQGPLATDPLAASDNTESREAAIVIPPPCLPPVIGDVTAAGLLSGAIVTPNAPVTGAATVVSWNFGGGATPNTSNQLTPSVTLGAPGTYNGSLFISNSCGSRLKNFTYTIVANPWTARSGPIPANTAAQQSSIALFNDKPAMAYYNATAGDLMFATASTSEPYGANWTLTTVESAGTTGMYPQLVVAPDGRPKIVYQDVTNGDLKIAQSVPAFPTQTSHWNLTLIDSAGIVGIMPSATYHTNDLLVSYYDQTNQNVKVIGALIGSFPSGPASWTNMSPTALSTDDGTYSSIRALNGTAHLAYSSNNGDLRYAIGTVSSSPNWTRYAIENPGVAYNQMAMCLESNGRPAVAYRNSNGHLRIARANSTTPFFASDWTKHTAMDAFFATFVHSMVLSEGKLAVAYYGGNADGVHIMVAQTNSATPTSKNNWYVSPVTPGANVSYVSSLMNIPVDGAADQLSISFINGDNRLHYGWRY